VAQAFRQLTHFVSAVHVNLLHQIATGDMADALHQTVKRGDQHVFDAEPDGNDHRQHCQQDANNDPDSHAVGAVVVCNGEIVQLVILLQELNVLLLESILIALGRLIEEFVDFACAQQLDKLSQRTVIDIVLALDLLG